MWRNNKVVGDMKNLIQRILSNWQFDLPDFSSAVLSSIDVATATPHSSALHMKQSFASNYPKLNFRCISRKCRVFLNFPQISQKHLVFINRMVYNINIFVEVSHDNIGYGQRVV